MKLPSAPRGLPVIPGLPFGFHYQTYAALDVPADWAPYSWPTPCERVADVNSVALRMIGGKLYDHPVGEAYVGYLNLNAYRLTGDEFYLHHAQAQADRLIACRVASSGGWFYPYRFDFSISPSAVNYAPWYSAMAQGMALGLFTRLYEVTGIAKYKQAADFTFASFLVPPRRQGPWVVAVDGQGYLCLEEYPGTPWQFVFNGHMYAAFGLYDYYLATRDLRALTLYQGALTSVIHYAPAIRNQGWISAYSSGVRAAFPVYHEIHIELLLEMYTISGDEAFADTADQFAQDYPDPIATGDIQVSLPTLTGYRFSNAGAVIEQRTITLSQPELLAIDGRKRVHGDTGYWFTVAEGDLTGYSVCEVPGAVYFVGQVATLSYLPARDVVFCGGVVVGSQYDSQGNVTATLTMTMLPGAAAKISQRAVIDGIPSVLISGGDLDGYWVPQGTLLDATAPTTTPFGVGWFHRDSQITLIAEDTGSGVGATDYAIDGGSWMSGTTVPILVSLGQGRHIVSYDSSDNQGNVEAAASCVVGIDTRQPYTKASPATVVRGGVAQLRCAVIDAAPCAGWASVQVQVKTLAGRLVYRLKYVHVHTGVWFYPRFRCSLAGGTYRYYVYATDAAGNAQSTVGASTLVVR